MKILDKNPRRNENDVPTEADWKKPGYQSVESRMDSFNGAGRPPEILSPVIFSHMIVLSAITVMIIYFCQLEFYRKVQLFRPIPLKYRNTEGKIQHVEGVGSAFFANLSRRMFGGREERLLSPTEDE